MTNKRGTIACSIVKDACCKWVYKIDAWKAFLKTVITEIDECHFLMVRQIWCFHFNVEASTVILFYHFHIKLLKRVLSVIVSKMTENFQLLQNVMTNLLRSIFPCKHITNMFSALH